MPDEQKEFNIACGMKVIKYNHHGNNVFVLKDKQGQHRDHCLCWICGKFYPEPEVPVKAVNKNCPIARILYLMCVLYKLVTPVWECPEWIPPRPDQLDEREEPEGGPIGSGPLKPEDLT